MYVQIQKILYLIFILDKAVFSPVCCLKNLKPLIKFIYNPENFEYFIQNIVDNIPFINNLSSILDLTKSHISDHQQFSIHRSNQNSGQYLQNPQNISDFQKDFSVLNSNTKSQSFEKFLSSSPINQVRPEKEPKIGQSIKIGNFFKTPPGNNSQKDEDEWRKNQQTMLNSFKEYLNIQTSEDCTTQSTIFDSASRIESILSKKNGKSNTYNSSSFSSSNFDSMRLSNVKYAVINLVDSPKRDEPNLDINKRKPKIKSRISQSADFSIPQSSLKYPKNDNKICSPDQKRNNLKSITKKLGCNNNDSSSFSSAIKKITGENKSKNEVSSVKVNRKLDFNSISLQNLHHQIPSDQHSFFVSEVSQEKGRESVSDFSTIASNSVLNKRIEKKAKPLTLNVCLTPTTLNKIIIPSFSLTTKESSKSGSALRKSFIKEDSNHIQTPKFFDLSKEAGMN